MTKTTTECIVPVGKTTVNRLLRYRGRRGCQLCWAHQLLFTGIASRQREGNEAQTLKQVCQTKITRTMANLQY